MSVYRPKDKRTRKLSPIYVYDFRLGNHRFSGSTGTTTRAAAREYEDGEKKEQRARLKASAALKAVPMTIDVAADRFWLEVGRYYRGGAGATFETALAWIVTQLGKDKQIRAITNSDVAELVARRRGEGVSPATVNRTVTEPLRRVLRRAHQAWDQSAAAIIWREHMLAEPRERVRELRPAEETKILAALREDYRPIVRFALLTGFRLAECVGLRWADVDFGERRLHVRGKGDKVATIPLTPAVRETIWPLKGHHDEAVFTYEVVKPRRSGEIERRRGERRPITYEGLKTQWRRAAHDVPDFRFHDLRHTAATRLLRASKNLKLVQKLLRHDDIATTSKYAHVDDDDLRRAMEAAECQEKRQDRPKRKAKPRRKSIA